MAGMQQVGFPLEETTKEQSISATEYNAPTDQGRSALWKTDISVLPLLFLGLLVFQLDRMNLASALTGGFNKAIGIDQSSVNLGNQLMFLGIVVLEIPSNMILQDIGPRKWISGQVFVFGLVATLQVFIRNRAGFLVSRSFLGLCEAGYIPGAIYTLSTWYTQQELARRVGLFFFGMFGGNAISPILASGILKLEGRGGLAGWQWLFLLEGVFTMAVGIMLLLLLPGSPKSPRPLLSPGVIRFSKSDQQAIQQRLDSGSMEGKQSGDGVRIPLSLVWKTVRHYKRWPHFASTFAVFSTWSPLTTYTPTILMALGFDRVSANALAAVGGFLALIVVFAFSWLSDRTGRRGICVIAAQACYLIALLIARSLLPHASRWSRWGLWTAINAFAVGYHPNHNTWVQVNCRDPGERSISIAMWVMSAISGLMVGTQYYRGDDVPFYHNGLRTQAIMVSLGMAFAILQEGIYYFHNKRVVKNTHENSTGDFIVYIL